MVSAIQFASDRALVADVGGGASIRIVGTSLDVLVPLSPILDREYQRGIDDERRRERERDVHDPTGERQRIEHEVQAHLTAIAVAMNVLDHDESVRLALELERLLNDGESRVSARMRAESYETLANVELNRSMQAGDPADVSAARIRAREFLARARNATQA